MSVALENAKHEKFLKSTMPELRAYAEECGIDVAPAATYQQLRRQLCITLNIDASEVPAQPIIRRPQVAANKQIFPPYNLSPDGVWGGRRHRIVLPRPEGKTMAKSEGFGWNGKSTYYINFGEPTDVPEPILNILRQNKRRRPVQVKAPLPDGSVEIRTGWEFDPVSMSYVGITPGTENLAGSMTEWYQMQGPSWFNGLTLREMQEIATRVDLPINIGKGDSVKQRDEDTLRGDLKRFFFGYADAIEAEPAPGEPDASELVA